jgi:hypothetical protein
MFKLAAAVMVATTTLTMPAPADASPVRDHAPVIRTEWMPCGAEDDNGCVWAARTRGNHLGRSWFANQRGRVFVIPHVMAETLIYGRITRP